MVRRKRAGYRSSPLSFRFLALFIVVSAPVFPAEGKLYQLDLQKAFTTKLPWKAVVIAEKHKGVRLCFSASDYGVKSQCYTSIIRIPGSSNHHAANAVHRLRVLASPHWVEFVTSFSDNGSGRLQQMAFWRYDAFSDRFIQAGEITLTEQGEYRWMNGMLFTAQAFLQKGETHFSNHHFAIDGYCYSTTQTLYKVLHYITDQPYPSLDTVDRIQVLKYERKKIRPLRPHC